jgi:hypothetical protein
MQHENTAEGDRRSYKIYAIVEKPGDQKNVWLDIGFGNLNRDGSITCRFDCLPLSGLAQLRIYEPKNSNENAGYTKNSPPKRAWHEGGK